MRKREQRNEERMITFSFARQITREWVEPHWDGIEGFLLNSRRSHGVSFSMLRSFSIQGWTLRREAILLLIYLLTRPNFSPSSVIRRIEHRIDHKIVSRYRKNCRLSHTVFELECVLDWPHANELKWESSITFSPSSLPPVPEEDEEDMSLGICNFPYVILTRVACPLHEHHNSNRKFWEFV